MDTLFSKYRLLVLLIGFALVITIILSNTHTVPDLPTDDWERHPTPIFSAGDQDAEGLVTTAIADPDTFFDPETQEIHMWYQESRAPHYTSSDIHMMIRHAHRPIDATPWTLDPTPALALPNEPTAWDASKTETPSVVFDPNAPEDRRYKLYYSGASNMHAFGFPEYKIGLAISSDGNTFRRLPAEESPYGLEGLVLEIAEAIPDLEGLAGGVVADPDVQIIDHEYHLWYSSFAHDSEMNFLAFGISHAVSSDGIGWRPSPNNPIPSLRNPNNVAGQQPSVAWNDALERWEMWFTSDSDSEIDVVPSTFNPALGFWMASSKDAITWEIDYSKPRDLLWRPKSPLEEHGLLTGAEVIILNGERHIFYSGWGSVDVPNGFIVPVRDRRGYVPAVLNLIHATKPASFTYHSIENYDTHE